MYSNSENEIQVPFSRMHKLFQCVVEISGCTLVGLMAD